MDTAHLIPIAEYAARIGKCVSSVRQKCQRGAVPGAVKIGRDWLIPKNAPYPDHRVKSGQYRDWRRKSEDTPASDP